jgi:hypothetical protein
MTGGVHYRESGRLLAIPVLLEAVREVLENELGVQVDEQVRSLFH